MNLNNVHFPGTGLRGPTIPNTHARAQVFLAVPRDSSCASGSKSRQVPCALSTHSERRPVRQAALMFPTFGNLLPQRVLLPLPGRLFSLRLDATSPAIGSPTSYKVP